MFLSGIQAWIEKHKWQTFLIGFGLFIAPLILVHVAYRITAISPWFASTWESGELITYIAGFEAFLGSAFLGVIALIQTQDATERAKASNEISTLMLNNEAKRDAFERQASIMLINSVCNVIESEDFKAPPIGVFICHGRETAEPEEQGVVLTLTLVNSSKSFSIIEFNEFSCLDISGEIAAFHCKMFCFKDQTIDRMHVAPNEKFIVYFEAQRDLYDALQSVFCKLSMTLCNSVGEYRNEIVKFQIEKLSEFELSTYDIRYTFSEM